MDKQIREILIELLNVDRNNGLHELPSAIDNAVTNIKQLFQLEKGERNGTINSTRNHRT